MANIIDQVGSSLGQFGWSSMGDILLVVFVFLILVIIFLGAGVWMWWRSFHLVVKIYEPKGKIPLTKEQEQEWRKLSQEEQLDKAKKDKIVFENIKYRRTHGKHTKHKGTPYFQTFVPLRRHEPVPMDFMFDDGIHMLRLSRS